MTPLHRHLRALCTAFAGVALALCAAAAPPSMALRPTAEVNISRTPTATDKARLARLAYVHDGRLRRAWLFSYIDGPAGRQNVYVRASLDNGLSWADPLLLSRDAAGAPTGGQPVTTRDAATLEADNSKPGLFAPPVTSGPKVVVTWSSGYCPADPTAGHGGSYASPRQGTGDLDGDGIPDRPFHCLWVATTTDPALADWDVQQLTRGERDAMNEVIAGSSDGRAFALAWQEDPSGLQPGEAEGRGDGGSGAHVSGGTNIWYAQADRPDGALLRGSIVTVSDNLVLGPGAPGASRPNLSISGNTAVLAYEESSCAGGQGGKCIVYHAFPLAAPDAVAAGTVISDVRRNARRVRIVLQGAKAAGESPLRAALLWRESAPGLPAAPADLMLRRGLVDARARPGSDGMTAADLLADAPQALTDVAASGGNINAHRAVVRGNVVLVAFDLTHDMRGADPAATDPPTANYNLHLMRSDEAGAPGRWHPRRNLSQLDDPAWTVVEPRLVPTPGTVVDPITGRPAPEDLQDTAIVYLAYGTERNNGTHQRGRILVSRSVDLGMSFEPFVPVSAAAAGQSEAQLRPAPDGRSAAVLWMAEQQPGDAQSQDAAHATLVASALPDLAVHAPDARFAAGAARTLNLHLTNTGPGDARGVRLDVQLDPRLQLIGLMQPSACRQSQTGLQCQLDTLTAGMTVDLSLTVQAASAGDYTATLVATSDWLDINSDNDLRRVALTATAAEVVVPPPVEPPADPPADPPLPPPEADPPSARGGGCSAAPGHAGFDPVWAILLLLAAAGLASPRR